MFARWTPFRSRKDPRGNVYRGVITTTGSRPFWTRCVFPPSLSLREHNLRSVLRLGGGVRTLSKNDKILLPALISEELSFSWPGTAASEVRLVTEVDVRVLHARGYNQVFWAAGRDGLKRSLPSTAQVLRNSISGDELSDLE